MPQQNALGKASSAGFTTNADRDAVHFAEAGGAVLEPGGTVLPTDGEPLVHVT
jgi:hypothetical protein